MSDGIEHFITTINQSNPELSPNQVQTIVNLLTESPDKQESIPEPSPVEIATPPPSSPPQPEGSESTSPDPELGELLPWSGESYAFDFKEDQKADLEKPDFLDVEPPDEIPVEPSAPKPAAKQLRFSTKQWALLVAFVIIEVIILVTFFWLILSNS